MSKRLAAPLIVACGIAGCGGDDDPVRVIRPEPLRAVPYSSEADPYALVVLPGGAVCLSDPLLVEVGCHRPATSAWVTFGRQGAGPGELGRPGPLVSVEESDSLVGVIDLALQRLTILGLDGRHVASVPTPSHPFVPLAGIRAGRVPGLTPGPPGASPQDSFLATVTVLDPAVGDRREVTLVRAPRPAGASAPLGLGRGVVLRDGTLVLHVHEHRFARFDPGGRFLDEFQYPAALRRPIYPTRLDLEAYRADMTRFGAPPTDAQMRARATTPSSPILPGIRSMRAGPGSTVLVGARRDRRTESYIDIFDADGRYVAALALDGRLIAFDARSDTLVALLERPGDDGAEPVREVRWYRMPGAQR